MKRRDLLKGTLAASAAGASLAAGRLAIAGNPDADLLEAVEAYREASLKADSLYRQAQAADDVGADKALVRRLDDLWEKAGERRFEAYKAALAIPAATAVGVVAKLIMTDSELGPRHGEQWDDIESEAIFSDVRRLTGRASV